MNSKPVSHSSSASEDSSSGVGSGSSGVESGSSLTASGSSGVLDSVGMFEAAAALPEQIEDAIQRTMEVDGLPAPGGISNILVIGMGGSGIVGDFLTVSAGPFISLPILVVKNYEPPSYVSDKTLVLAVSFSGNTEETLQAVTTAASLGGRIVAITTGGKLAELAAQWNMPVIPVDSTIPMPRAGLGAMAVPTLMLFERLGYFPGATDWLTDAAAHLKTRRDSLLADDNEAAKLARSIGRTVPIIYGGGGLGAVAALRMKTQVNENAKAPAFSAAVPEMCHNEIVGWGQHGDLTRQAFSTVFLRHDFEHPQVSRVYEVLRELLAEVTSGIYDLSAKGESPIAQLFDLIMLGDFVSLYMASQEGIDPGPVPVIAELKSRLGD